MRNKRDYRHCLACVTEEDQTNKKKLSNFGSKNFYKTNETMIGNHDKWEGGLNEV